MSVVALDRRFSEWGQQEPPDPELLLAMGVERGGLTWDDLVKRYRVVILAEAGSGKSTEMKQRARLLEANGQRSFFAALEDVGIDGLEGSLSAVDRKRLAEWRESPDEAWFFVDSVDEAKAAGVRLEKVMRRLADGIVGVEHRVHLVLSGRITDWEFRADLKLLEDWLAVPETSTITPEEELLQIVRQNRPKEQPDHVKPVVVLMAPLDQKRIKLFAECMGVAKPQDLLDQIDSADLWRFARRPLDLDWLVKFWQTEGRFGSLAEMISRGITERLKETNPYRQRQDSLDGARALHGVERIAAAMVFGRRFTVSIPDSEVAFSSDTPLELADILPDWSEEERASLLTRPIFDPATLGRARFHNDNEGVVRSYLTARWLRRLRDGNLTTGALFGLLFANSYGIEVVRPSLEETAAWLSLWDQDVAREVVRRSPGLLLTGGDPNSLPLEVRKNALIRFIEELATGNHESPWLENYKLRRFVHPRLGVTVACLWNQHKNCPEASEFLLRLAWLGTLKECGEIARDVALDSSRTAMERVFAGRLLVRTSDENAKRHYAKCVLAEVSTLPPMMVRDAVGDLFPAFLGVDDLLAVIRVPANTENDGGLDLKRDGPELVGKLNAANEIDKLLKGLLKLFPGEIAARNYRPLSRREEGTLAFVESATIRLLQISQSEDAPETAMDAVLVMGSWPYSGRKMVDVYQELHRTTSRRRVAFWQAVKRFRKPELEHRRIENLWQMGRLGYWPALRVEDIDWLLSSGLKGTEYDRRLVVNASLAIQLNAGSPDGVVEKIRVAASADPISEEAFNNWMQAQQTPSEPDEDPELTEIQRTNAAAEEARDHSWLELVRDLRANPARVAALRVPSSPVNVDLKDLWQLLERAGSRSQYAIDSLAPIERIAGTEVAHAAREGFIAHWRHNVPLLERLRPADQRHTIRWVDIMGVVGITLEAASVERWADKLTSDEARLATGYATLELNGFPSWLGSLAKAKPKEVLDALLSEIRWEFTSPEGSLHHTMGTVLHSGDELMALLSPSLLDEIEAGAVPDNVLAGALQIVVHGMHPNRKDGFVRFGLDQFEKNPTEPAAMLYLAAVFCLDPTSATDALFRAKDGKEEGEQSKLVNQFLMHNFGDMMSSPSFRANSVPVEVLERLVQCVFHPGRQPASPQRPSGVAYTPTEGDYLDRAHGALFNAFANTPGPGTYHALSRLQSQGCSIPTHRLRALAEERAVKDSETTPWPPAEVVAFEQTGETAPSTSKELRDLAVRLLGDIQHELLNHDFAQGKIVKNLHAENEVQVWVANALHQKRGRSFIVVREEHVVNEKEPDVRLRARASDAVVAIEIKATKSWTLKELEAALVKQLCGRYLRAANGKYGILLLVHQKARKWEDTDTGAVLSFPEVVTRLSALATKISGERADSPQPVVCVLDVSEC